MLSRGLSDINPRVVARARRMFSSQVSLAMLENRVESAIEIYEQTLALPQTATEEMLNAEGYQLNYAHTGNERTIVCFKGTIPLLLKALTLKEMTRGASLLMALQQQTRVNSHLISFELRTHGEKSFMIMPYYPCTLGSVRKLSVADGVRLFEQIHSAVVYLHSLNFNHMDIKPSNISLMTTGDCVLIDLGSVVMKQDMSESTAVYVPRDFQPRNKRTPSSRYQAVDFNDWLMLGMTIAEKVYGLKVGGRAPPPTVAELTSILEADGAFGKLIALFPLI